MSKLWLIAFTIGALLLGNAATAGDRHHGERDRHEYRHHDSHRGHHKSKGHGKHHYRAPRHQVYHHYHAVQPYYGTRYYHDGYRTRYDRPRGSISIHF